MEPQMNIWSKIGYLLVTLALVGTLVVMVPSCMTVDFTYIKMGLKPVTTKPKSNITTLPEENDYPEKSRDLVLSSTRARSYLTTATRDYYTGSYDDALRRLERAKWYDPTNFGIFKLSGQIFFEKARYRKAFNDLAHATQLPNDDQLISRDIDVLKRLIRYGRNEVDRLQQAINRNPDDQIAAAKLRDLEEQLQE